MNAILRFLCLFTLFIFGYHGHAAPTNSLRVTVELQDGSRVVGQSGDKNYVFRSVILGELKLPLEQIASIECQPKTNLVKLTAANGDKLAVTFAMKEIHLQTSFGDVKLPVDSIRRMQVSAAGMAGRTTAGLVALWSGEGNANDSVGGCNGQLVNDVGFMPGKVGQAFDLNEGFNDGFGIPSGRSSRGGGYVLIPASPILDVGKGDGFTIEGWINPTTTANPMPIVIYERDLGTGNGADVGMLFYISIAPPAATGPGCLVANVGDTDGVGHIISSIPGLVTSGVWQHVALSYDKSSGIGAIYLNGSVVGQTNLGSFTPQTKFTNLLIGGHTTYGSASRPSEKFSGKMDEIGIYNRALSAAEIRAICTEENNWEPTPPPTAVPRQAPFNSE